ncbi:hypothetical protein M413DRAFT_440844 [Hebeloma cylindrosporum]|uniref:Cytochrome P450 n=1 Tax=Hebeloma cylindrosporum TaxID=76867 RepID=A0A0C2YXX9_HEBCY|nr:hypothetical protein M413DRAFT_440844 [Hebeloma cylindrosporum h7]
MLDILPLVAFIGLIFVVAYSQARPSVYTALPNSPTTVPYLFPWIGSFFSFNRDPLRFFQECHQRYGHVYKVFLAGRIIVVITHPNGITSITRDTTRNLTNKDIFIHMLQGITGFSANLDSIHELLDHKIFPITKMTLSPSSMLDITEGLDKSLRRELRGLDQNKGLPRVIQLSDLIGRPLYTAGCYALFGSTFPFDTFSDFQALDSNLPQLLTQLPFIGYRGAHARDRLLSKIADYIEGWWESDGVEEIPEASTTVMQSLTELKASQVSKREAAGALLLLLWGFHSNTWYMLFWLVTHLVVDDKAMAQLTQDLEAARNHQSLPNNESNSPPLLESAILETLRWATTSTTVRFAEDDTEIAVNGLRVPINKGEYVMGDVRAVHHDLSTFEDPDQFRIGRYMTKEDRSAPLPKPMAWGGGKHMCVGRHVAVHVMRLFMLECLRLYEIKAVASGFETRRLPRISSRHFIGSLKTNEEVHVVISPRH